MLNYIFAMTVAGMIGMPVCYQRPGDLLPRVDIDPCLFAENAFSGKSQQVASHFPDKIVNLPENNG
jgi:hypothetical protein